MLADITEALATAAGFFAGMSPQVAADLRWKKNDADGNGALRDNYTHESTQGKTRYPAFAYK